MELSRGSVWPCSRWARSLLITLACGIPACSTDAVGVDACRQIESARCSAAPVCEGSDTPFGISTDDQVRNCQVFYHDHCLLGIENNSSTDDPDQDSQVTPCVKAIQTIAACQKAGTALGDCIDSNADGGGGAGPISILDSSITTPCQALLSPETIEACNFVALPPADASQ